MPRTRVNKDHGHSPKAPLPNGPLPKPGNSVSSLYAHTLMVPLIRRTPTTDARTLSELCIRPVSRLAAATLPCKACASLRRPVSLGVVRTLPLILVTSVSGRAGDVSIKNICRTSGHSPIDRGASLRVTVPAEGSVSNHPSSRLRSWSAPLRKTAVLPGLYGRDTVYTVFTPSITPDGTSNLGLGIPWVWVYIELEVSCN
jgi:hypothetical protein